VDVNILEERKKFIWSFTRAIKLESTEEATNYNHPDDSVYSKVFIEDREKGKLEILFLYSKASNQTMIVNLNLYFKWNFIDKWFGTKYLLNYK
jgi:hypothetical protein